MGVSCWPRRASHIKGNQALVMHRNWCEGEGVEGSCWKVNTGDNIAFGFL